MRHFSHPALAASVVLAASTGGAFAQSATRDLPDYQLSGSAASVSITLVTPPGTVAVGLEDRPPAGWVVALISNAGTFDSGTGKVKWGPFFGGSIPASVTYDVTPPEGGGGQGCFEGTISFDLLNQAIAGDACLAFNVPAATSWGLAVMALVLASAASLLLRRHTAQI